MGGRGADMIRLEEKPFELEGKRYMLRCNMAVLEAFEEAYGDIETAMEKPVRAVVLTLLQMMLNDYAEEQDWDERWTAARLKRRVSYAMLKELDLVGMLFRALTPAAKEKPAEGEKKPAESGN